MRTQKQIEAARRNGARSRGPVTAEGKARSAQNATKHGLSAKVVVLHNENTETWEEMLAGCLAQWQPATGAELVLVHDIAGARWRLHRALAMEAATLDHQMDLDREALDGSYARLDEPTRCALAFNTLSENGRALVSYGRYESRLRRIIDRASAELRRLRAEREQLPNAGSGSDSCFLQNEPGKRHASADLGSAGNAFRPRQGSLPLRELSCELPSADVAGDLRASVRNCSLLP